MCRLGMIILIIITSILLFFKIPVQNKFFVGRRYTSILLSRFATLIAKKIILQFDVKRCNFKKRNYGKKETKLWELGTGTGTNLNPNSHLDNSHKIQQKSFS